MQQPLHMLNNSPSILLSFPLHFYLAIAFNEFICILNSLSAGDLLHLSTPRMRNLFPTIPWPLICCFFVAITIYFTG